jgi:glucose-1-phosphate thymidylyltransferase
VSGHVGVILAAGRGSRMGPLAERYPKALLPVANRPLIRHQLAALRAAGIADVYIVVGSDGEKIERALGSGSGDGFHLRYMEQGAPLGSAHALGQLAPYIDEDFVLLLGDYFVSQLDLRQVLDAAAARGGSLILAKHETDRHALLDACALEIESSRRVTRVVEKPKVPRSNLKGCGVLVLEPPFFDAIRHTPRTMLRDEFELMVALDLHVRNGYPVYAHEFTTWDVNLTRPHDVLACNLRWLADRNEAALVGDAVSLPEGTQLDRAVVGHGVRLAQPATLREVVAFNGIEFGGVAVERALLTDHGVIECA